MVPITRRASSPKKKSSSGRLLEKLEKVKQAKRRRLEATSTATSTGTFTARARKSSDS